MTTSVNAQFVQPHAGLGGTGTVAPESFLAGGQPSWIYGEGTPDGDVFPWVAVAKGSLYTMSNASADASHIYMKIDNSGDDADWVVIAV